MKKIPLKSLIYSLLLSIPLTTTTIYAKWEMANNCKIWVEGETTQKPIKWSGSCKEGFASGKGKVQYNYKNEEIYKSCIGKMLKGKLDGYASCKMNNGDTFKGTIENNKMIGTGIYTWNTKKCPTCPKKYIGTFYNNLMAEGTATLANGTEKKVYYYPNNKDCLVWDRQHLKNEKIKWTGTCKDGYAEGKGMLTFTSENQIITVNGELKLGMIEGYAVVKYKILKNCNNCPIQFKGTYLNNEPIKGIVTLKNGQTTNFNLPQNNMTPEMDAAMAEYIQSQQASWMMSHIDMGLGIPLD